MTRDYDARSLPGHLDTHVYLAGELDGMAERLGASLKDAGACRVHRIASLEGLPAALRQRRHHNQPALAIVAADNLDEAFVARCSPILPLLEQLHVGLVVAVTAPALDMPSQMAALNAGCLDVLHTPQRQLPADIVTRLQLALRLLHEHHLRVDQEQRFLGEQADRRVRDARLNYLANHDELTDLANRAAFERALDKAIAVGRQKQLTHALLYLDLDRFKLHNEAAGHLSGNVLLQRVANQLRSALPPEYLLARIGADEFAVLLQGVDEREALATAEQLRKRVASIEPDGEQIVFHVGVSIGLGVFTPGAVRSSSQALVQAEQACYLAKTRGGDAVHRFSCEDEELQNLHEDMHWSQPIRQALGENLLFLAYQPILSVADARISHYEALVRIPRSLGGDDRSARFMLAAERLGLARQIDLWVVDKAIDFLAATGNCRWGSTSPATPFRRAHCCRVCSRSSAAAPSPPNGSPSRSPRRRRS